MIVRFTESSIEPKTIYDLFAEDEPGNVGSVLLHYAVVKVQKEGGRKTTGIAFAAKGDVEAELKGIAREMKQRWTLNEVVLLRRQGEVGVGEIISLVAASSPNSQDVFAACQYGIAALKKMTTIAKEEIYF
ncbi:MAG: molybdopterin synthase [Desulfuromonas sp.]|nr:MAG: molybdopterin synthase [Desulfuromonas sp.]